MLAARRGMFSAGGLRSEIKPARQGLGMEYLHGLSQVYVL